jgi:YHS domain-containing protein
VTLRVILLFVMALLALRAVARFMSGVSEAARGEAPRARATDTPVKMVKDPVCGTFVVPGKALSASASGATVWFCSEQCRDTFARRS